MVLILNLCYGSADLLKWCCECSAFYIKLRNDFTMI